ncbi:hypothetical protein SEUCBS139899_006540 [Sporothrix eucalyptigena]
MSWYSDVLHEIKPFTKGSRFVLTFNLAHDPADVDTIPASVPTATSRLKNESSATAVDPVGPRMEEAAVNWLDEMKEEAVRAQEALDALKINSGKSTVFSLGVLKFQ